MLTRAVMERSSTLAIARCGSKPRLSQAISKLPWLASAQRFSSRSGVGPSARAAARHPGVTLRDLDARVAEQIAHLFEPPGLAPPAGNQRRHAGMPEVIPSHAPLDASLLEVFVEAVQLASIAPTAAWRLERESERTVP